MSKTRLTPGTYQCLPALPAVSVLESKGGAWGLLAVKEPLKQRRLPLQRRSDSAGRGSQERVTSDHFRYSTLPVRESQVQN